jgi:hypothetical protein
LLASVRDFARITWFWLNKGNWNGKQVLPRKFFDRYQHPDVPVDLPWSTQAATDDYLHIGSYGGDSNQKVGEGPGIYGFNWWFNAYGQSNRDRLTWPDAPKDTFMSLGARGNSSAIIPSLNMVVVGAFAKWGEEEPGRAEALLNRRLKMVISAVRVRRIRLAK